MSSSAQVISYSDARNKCWDTFSIYIRTRDCLRTANCPDYGYCVTCGAYLPFKSLQAGHFIAGRHNGVLFDDRNCHNQCYRCNMVLKSNPVAYELFMMRNYSEDIINTLFEKNRQDVQIKAFELLELNEQIKKATKDLLKKYKQGVHFAPYK